MRLRACGHRATVGTSNEAKTSRVAPSATRMMPPTLGKAGDLAERRVDGVGAGGVVEEVGGAAAWRRQLLEAGGGGVRDGDGDDPHLLRQHLWRRGR